ncbi:uncharacterized protein LOC127653728 [Xyrauchen texanus]|uniref:uncharacterized protein LOC127653728 n=1 Tax=Xyrauchen texanus TaxID=154827 RepID=UPI002241E427|nr:uncharacterized protein LOC127653728 [Xyrauchen texanus]
MGNMHFVEIEGLVGRVPAQNKPQVRSARPRGPAMPPHVNPQFWNLAIESIPSTFLPISHLPSWAESNEGPELLRNRMRYQLPLSSQQQSSLQLGIPLVVGTCQGANQRIVLHIFEFSSQRINCFVLPEQGKHGFIDSFGLCCSLSLHPYYLWKLECQPTVGIAAQVTVIRCLIKCSGLIEVVGVALIKGEQEKPVFEHIINKTPSGDPRFSLVSPAKDPSLQISDTVFSDEGEYEYYVVTNMGEKRARLSISVVTKYRDPVTSSWPENVTDGGPVNLYCNATDGYPAGTIHWFDHSGTNWTINYIMTKAIKETNGSKSVALLSKLSFKFIDSSLAPFRYVVFNSKFVKEGEKTFQTMLKRN